MDPALRDAVLGAGGIQPSASPLGSFPELSRMYASSAQLPQATGAANILTNQATDIVKQREAAASAKKSKAKYRRIKRSDGGFGFYDPDGNEISAHDYAAATDSTPSQVLSDSENPIDIGYQQDYKNLQEYINNKLNAKHDQEANDAAVATEQQVKKAYGVDLGKLTPSQLIDKFKEQYPTIYGRKNTGVPAGQVFVPRRQEVDPTGGSGGGVGG
jgi:hypothetical protein